MNQKSELSRCDIDDPCNGGVCTLKTEYPYFLGSNLDFHDRLNVLECDCTGTGKTGVYCDKKDNCGVGYYGENCDISRCRKGDLYLGINLILSCT